MGVGERHREEPSLAEPQRETCLIKGFVEQPSALESDKTAFKEVYESWMEELRESEAQCVQSAILNDDEMQRHRAEIQAVDAQMAD